jgi:uncharacterized Zn-binding protein involved in type VI secretion
MTVENDSGSTITLKDNGDVIINNDGDVLIGDDDSSNTKPVARKGDQVVAGGNTGEITEGSDSVESE